MDLTSRTCLKPLLESRNGNHLTAYLNGGRGVAGLRNQIKETIEVATEYLRPTLNPQEMGRLLEPIRGLLKDSRLLKGLNGNVGLFRTPNSFRLLRLPVEVEQVCVVATTFHVKPLLRWMQIDRDFLLLGLENGAASLYQGNQQTFQFVDAVLFPEALGTREQAKDYSSLKRERLKAYKLEETLSWVNTWLVELTKEVKPRLFIAGERKLIDSFTRQLTYENFHKGALAHSFRQETVVSLCSEIRATLRKEARRSLESSLVEFYHAEDLNLAKRNIFQIAKAAIQGRIRKLIIADRISIFGKLDPKTGSLSIHPADLDHEDDDLLDDLAQTVLSKGGEVVVADRDEIPKGHPILAILDRGVAEFQMTRAKVPNVHFERRLG